MRTAYFFILERRTRLKIHHDGFQQSFPNDGSKVLPKVFARKILITSAESSSSLKMCSCSACSSSFVPDHFQRSVQVVCSTYRTLLCGILLDEHAAECQEPKNNPVGMEESLHRYSTSEAVEVRD